MKYILSITLLLLFGQTNAQTSEKVALSQNKSILTGSIPPRFISVNGYSEKEVSPDIIYVSVTIREYFTDNAQKHKAPIDELEKNFLRTVYDTGIPASNISIEGISGYANWEPHKKNENFLASKRYQIKLVDLDKMNTLMTQVDPKAVSSIYVSGYDYSHMADLKRQLRTEAMLDAKIKASYMLEALEERAGPVLEVEEQQGDQSGIRPLFMARSMVADGQASQAPDLEFKKVKVSSTVVVKFEIDDK